MPAYSRLAERGIVTAILQFRESTIAPFPAQVEDAKAALRFLAARAEDYHIDTERIFIAGNLQAAILP
ncbi:MAG: alpha/beta hydrolase fold domain-containing protein [Eisenbergiella massiliensis]|nr:alpha/beta hydrolase fold domain-containing protein [Eisenbergiella massiliensis]